MTTERRIYQRPPIREAVCEIIFAGANEWSIEAPVALFEELRGTYGARPEQNLEQGLELREEPRSLLLPAAQLVLKLASEDGVHKATIRADRLTAHVASPYPGWEVFSDDIESVAKSFDRVRSPEGVARIGIRYINEIDVKELAWQELLTCPPHLPPSMQADQQSFLQRTQSVLTTEPDVQVVQTLAGAAVEGETLKTILLDIDVYRIWPSGLPLGEVAARVQELRAHERKVFESAITEVARESFDE